MFSELKKIEQSEMPVLVIGDLMLDSYLIGNSQRVSPEAPIPIVNVQSEVEKLGGAANVAANVHALGMTCSLFGVVGEDMQGNTLIGLLESEHISYCIPRITDYVTTNKKRVISRNQQLLRIDREQICPITEPALKVIYEGLEQTLITGCSVIFSDYGKGLLSAPQKFMSIAQRHHAKVFVDPKGTSFEPYRGAYVITPNLFEFESVAGVCKTEAELIEHAVRICRQVEIEHLLITRSDKGMLLVGRDGFSMAIAADAHEVFDVTGAGDTVIATLASAVAAGVEMPRAVELANVAAGIVVQKLGAATVALDEIASAQRARLDHSMSEDELCAHLKLLQEKGRKIVMTNGCFDLLHRGHVQYLQQARQLGDYLVVAVNDDASVSRLKGSSRPINTLEARMGVLQALQCVDFVIPFAADTPEELICKFKPNVLVKGGDYEVDQIAGAKCVMDQGGEVKVLPYLPGFSTSTIIERLKSGG